MLVKIRSWIMVAAIAMTGVCTAGDAVVGQDCGSCSTCSDTAVFGYPSGCCGGGVGGHRDAHRAQREANQQRRQLVAARNDAWPKPFDCLDRQTYFSMWRPFVEAGYERHCVLSSVHFDRDTNELNDYGRTMLAGIIQNMPQARKTVFIHQDTDLETSQARMDHVRSTINGTYGHMTSAQVAFSNELPFQAPANRLEVLSELEFDNVPTPVIPIATGTNSVSSSIQQ